MATKKSSDSKSSGSKLKLNFDFKTLLVLLPAVLAVIGKVTKKDEKNGHFEFEEEDSSGNLLGFALDLLEEKDGKTSVSVTPAHDTKEEKSAVGDLISTLDTLNTLTGKKNSTANDVLSVANALSGNNKKNTSATMELVSVMTKLL